MDSCLVGSLFRVLEFEAASVGERVHEGIPVPVRPRRERLGRLHLAGEEMPEDTAARVDVEVAESLREHLC